MKRRLSNITRKNWKVNQYSIGIVASNSIKSILLLQMLLQNFCLVQFARFEELNEWMNGESRPECQQMQNTVQIKWVLIIAEWVLALSHLLFKKKPFHKQKLKPMYNLERKQRWSEWVDEWSNSGNHFLIYSNTQMEWDVEWIWHEFAH